MKEKLRACSIILMIYNVSFRCTSDPSISCPSSPSYRYYIVFV